MTLNLNAKISDRIARKAKLCPRGHRVSFLASSPGVIACTCAECTAKNGIIYRGHGLDQTAAYLSFLLAVSSW